MKVALLADVHANGPALTAVLDDIDRAGVERILVAGDLIGYYYWPQDIVARLRGDSRVTCIRGNHEDMLAAARGDPAALAAYHAKYGSGLSACLEQLDTAALDWLCALPVSAEMELDGVTLYMSHGGLGSSDVYLYPDCAADILARHYSTCAYTIFGHTHYPFVHHRGEQAMINPGSVGQARDQGGGASYAILRTDNRSVQPRRVQYDTGRVAAVASQRDPHLAYLHKVLER